MDFDALDELEAGRDASAHVQKEPRAAAKLPDAPGDASPPLPPGDGQNGDVPGLDELLARLDAEDEIEAADPEGTGVGGLRVVSAAELRAKLTEEPAAVAPEPLPEPPTEVPALDELLRKLDADESVLAVEAAPLAHPAGSGPPRPGYYTATQEQVEAVREKFKTLDMRENPALRGKHMSHRDRVIERIFKARALTRAKAKAKAKAKADGERASSRDGAAARPPSDLRDHRCPEPQDARGAPRTERLPGMRSNPKPAKPAAPPPSPPESGAGFGAGLKGGFLAGGKEARQKRAIAEKAPAPAPQVPAAPARSAAPARDTLEETVMCGKCGMDVATKPLRCSRCQVIYYCSPECQKSDWKRHKPFCVVGGPPDPGAGGVASSSNAPYPSAAPVPSKPTAASMTPKHREEPTPSQREQEQHIPSMEEILAQLDAEEAAEALGR